MARDKVKRAFVWIRQSMRITQRTTLPAEILSEIRPGLDTFGWDRLSPSPSGEGNGPRSETTTGGAAANVVILTAVPAGVMRYVMYASVSHDDPVAGGLLLSLQCRSSAIDFGLQNPFQSLASPARVGLERPILLAPGEQLLARCVPDPAVATSMFLRYRFVDIDFGEYIKSF